MSGWPVKMLGDVCQVIGGGTPPKNRPDFYHGDIPWATVRDEEMSYLTPNLKLPRMP
jgi:type I restriction enzyme S subunit